MRRALALLAPFACLAAAQQQPDPIQPFFAKNCTACHNVRQKTGNLNLEEFTPATIAARRDEWEAIARMISTGQMPPPMLPRPDRAAIQSVTNFLQREFDRLDAAAKPAPGRVTARRLNRAEYNNTIRDLVGVDFKPAGDFPQDDSGYGFDNIADALSLSPVLMEKYLSAAERIVRTALNGPELFKPTVVRHQPPYRAGSDGGDNSRFLSILPYTVTDYDLTGLSLPAALHTLHRFPAEGIYEFRIDPEGNRPKPSDPFSVAVWIDEKQIGTVTFEASDNPTSMEGVDQLVRLRAPAGEHWVAVSPLRVFEGLPAKYGGLKPTAKPEPPPRPLPEFKPPPDVTPKELAEFEEMRKQFLARMNRPARITDVNFRINFVEITGPFDQKTGPAPESLAKIFSCGHTVTGSAHTAACARKIVAGVARRAYRRPPATAEVNRLLALTEQSRTRGATFEQSIGTALTAMLVSPHFLFRIEKDPAPGPHPVTAHELASRLSYFLWSSMPDEELLRLADRGTLGHPAVLSAQVRRMLANPKSKALVENFGGQWLQFRALESVKPDPERFMAFDDYVRLSMKRETELFFENMIREDGRVLDFVDARYTYLNQKLAEFYGIPNVKGPEFRKVMLDANQRGGVLTHGSVLTVSSYATRTSVVLRGKWVLENLLNAPVPPPPPDVPPLDEAGVGATMSLRQQMEKHRANAICASCHSRMDPLGFGLENFDAIGRWRTSDGKFPIDASGKLPDGTAFDGPAGLRAYLQSNSQAFLDGVSEKLLIYALGRGLERFDRPAVKQIARHAAGHDARFSSLVLGVVTSLPFQQRQGDPVPDVSHR
jgi:hypothetical protein